MKRLYVRKRRRGTAIVETEQGIIVAADKKVFLLPGGGAKGRETRIEAAIRELRDETGLIAYSVEYLFEYEGPVHTTKGGSLFQDYHKVFSVRAHGQAKPKHEIAAVDYYKAGAEINPKLSRTTLEIIDKYLER